MNKKQHIRLREIQNVGWQATKTDEVRFNGGSETIEHATLKMVAAKLITDRGMKVSSEVVHDELGEIDVLSHGPLDGKAFAVEVESGLTPEVQDDKMDRYVDGEVIRECFFLPVEDAPENIHEMEEWVEGRIF